MDTAVVTGNPPASLLNSVTIPFPPLGGGPGSQATKAINPMELFTVQAPTTTYMSDSLIKPTLYPSARDIRTITWTNLVPGPYPVHNNTVIF